MHSSTRLYTCRSSRKIGRGDHYPNVGPVQSKGMCLLDLSDQLHWKPNPWTSLVAVFPHVMICPGPTSDPGGLWSCTRDPAGVVGPASASANAFNFPGISARQYARSLATSNWIGRNSRP